MRRSTAFVLMLLLLAGAGIAFGTPPGRWILHATSPAGEIDPVDLEVRADETVRAGINLRK